MEQKTSTGFAVSFSDGLAIAAVALTIILVVLDKAGKLRGPVLFGLLGVASAMLIPLAVGNAWASDAQGAVRVFRVMFGCSTIAVIYSLLSLWISTGEATPERQPEATHSTASDPLYVAREHLKSPRLLTLYDLFLTDFPMTQAIGGHRSLLKDKNVSITIEEFVLIDLERNSKWIKAYIPNYDDTYGVCEAIFHNYTKELADADLFGMSQKPWGGSALHTSKGAVFLRTIFIYHESELRPEQIGDLTRLFMSDDIQVDFRSGTYLSIKARGQAAR